MVINGIYTKNNQKSTNKSGAQWPANDEEHGFKSAGAKTLEIFSFQGLKMLPGRVKSKPRKLGHEINIKEGWLGT